MREGLREVIDRRILVPAPDRSDARYVFSHALLREVIHGSLLPGERARLHARYAEALEGRARERAEGAGGAATGPPPTAAELAYHWEAAGDARRALAATVDAGVEAERGYAYLDAHGHYLRALDLWAVVPDATAALDRVDVLVRAAETAVLLGEYGPAVDLGERALALVDPAADPARAAALHERQRWYLWEAGDKAAAAAAVEAAESLVPRDPPSAARARILAHRAGILMLGGRLGDSIPVAEEAIAVARAVGGRSEEALGLGCSAGTSRCSGGWRRAWRPSARVSRSPRSSAGRRGSRSGPRTSRSCSTGSGGRPRRSTSPATAGSASAPSGSNGPTAGSSSRSPRRPPSRSVAGTTPTGSSGSGSHAGRSGRPGSACASSAAGSTRSVATWRRPRPRSRRPAIADAAAGGRTDDRPALIAAIADLAVAEGRRDRRPGRRREGFGSPSTLLPDPALATLGATALRLEADLAGAARARRDDAALAESRARVDAIAGQVERIAAMLGVPPGIAAAATEPTRDRAMAALCRAEVARFDDRDEPTDWDAVAAAFDGIGRPYAAAYARYRSAAATLRTRGPRADAAATLAEARSTAAAPRSRRPCSTRSTCSRARLGSISPTATTPPTAADAAPPSDLTERELEVLRLIAAGWSNQQIADALFISRKTASVHASHIFDKLGAANRIDAAAIARRLGVEAGPPPPGAPALGRAPPTTPRA